MTARACPARGAGRTPGLRLVRVADRADLARLERALAALSADLGDGHAATHDSLAGALFGPHPAAHGLLALEGEETCGAALFSPVYSTVAGAAGVYVSDLWVAPAARGRGLGRRLLAGVGAEADALWGAGWLKLAVYDHSTAAQAFYRRLGFAPALGMREMRLDAAGLAALRKETG
ncbi:MAG: GNAT family N-acetyltransferase [Alkalilacustris sp.]